MIRWTVTRSRAPPAVDTLQVGLLRDLNQSLSRLVIGCDLTKECQAGN